MASNSLTDPDSARPARIGPMRPNRPIFQIQPAFFLLPSTFFLCFGLTDPDRPSQPTHPALRARPLLFLLPGGFLRLPRFTWLHVEKVRMSASPIFQPNGLTEPDPPPLQFSNWLSPLPPTYKEQTQTRFTGANLPHLAVITKRNHAQPDTWGVIKSGCGTGLVLLQSRRDDPKIARRFIAGKPSQTVISPGGTAKVARPWSSAVRLVLRDLLRKRANHSVLPRTTWLGLSRFPKPYPHDAPEMNPYSKRIE